MKTYINDGWYFIEGFEESYLAKIPKTAEKITLPHPARVLPYHCFTHQDYEGIFTYIKTFDAPNALPVQFLVFEGAMLQFDCYLNDVHLGHFVSGYLPVKINISKVILKKNNRLVVKLDSHEDPLIPPFGNVVDYMTFAGIYRKVYIESHPNEYIESALIQGKADGTLDIHLNAVGDSPFYFELYDGEKRIHRGKYYSEKIPNIQKWSIHNPHLYHLVIHYGKDILEADVGFRDIDVAEDGFYLNGERVKLRGLNRHQAYPYIGGAAPDAMQIDDAHILKYELGCNVVRTSHYPQDESFLNECDRIGLLVIDEIPGWQFISKEPLWRERCLDFARRMIIKERNHPSLIFYGLRIDESQDDHDLYSRIQEIKQELDPYRPSIGVRYFKDSELLEDIYGYNDFSCSSIHHGLDKGKSYKKHKKKPKLVTEHNGHMFPTKSFDTTSRRAEQAYRHALAISDAYGDKKLIGAIGWCAFDYNTHKTFGNLDHICYHGVCDIFRNPKYAAFAYQSQQDDIPVLKVASTLCSSDYDGALIPVPYIYSNCDEIRVTSDGVPVGVLRPDKKHFPHLPHPPFEFFDLVGERFQEKGFKRKKENRKITNALSYVAHYGMDKMRVRDALLLFKASIRHHLSFVEIYQLYGKYISGWGSDGLRYEFTGIKDGKEVIKAFAGPTSKYLYQITATKKELVYGDTYDVARVKILCVDEYGNTVAMDNSVFELETDGPIRILGPNKGALVGGGICVYVASKKVKKETIAALTIHIANQDFTLQFEVK